MDDLICRDRDTSIIPDGTLDERIYALTDASFSITAIANSAGAILERYAYTPYGRRSVLTAAFAPQTVSLYNFQIGMQGLLHDTESGLIYNRARYLHPQLGRFIQRDPLGYVDGMSLYAGYHLMGGGFDPLGLAEKLHSWKGSENGVEGTFYQWEYFDWSLFQFLTTGTGKFNVRYGPITFEPDLIDGGFPASLGSTQLKGNFAAFAVGVVITTEIGGGALIVGSIVMPGPDDALLAAILSRRGFELAKCGTSWVIRKGGKLIHGDDATKAMVEIAEALMNARRAEIRKLGNIPAGASPVGSGTFKGGRWWEYLDSDGNIKIIVEHADGSVHVGLPKPGSKHKEGGIPKYFEEHGIHANEQ